MLGAFLVAALAGHLGADEAVRGRLCIMEPGRTAVVERCSEVEGTDFDVAAAPAERVWVWSRRNLRTVALGKLDAGTTRIRLPDEPLPTTLEITGSADRDWPQPTTIAIGRFDRPAFWKIELSPMHAERLREILLPRGSWSLSVRAERHIIASFPPFRLIDEPVELGRVELEPLPRILGTVIDGEGELLPSVLLIAGDGTPLATSGGEGELLWEASCSEDRESCFLPEWVRLEYPGTATLWFHAIRRDRSLDLDVVRMAPGGTLDLRIDRSAVLGRIVVEIVDDPKPVPPLERYPTVARLELSEDEELAVIEHLPEGMLRVDLRGTTTGEVYSEYVVIRAGETLVYDVALRPTTLVFEVTGEGKRIRGVPIRVEQLAPPHHVSQTMPTDAEGRTSLTLWQPGAHTARLAHIRLRGGTVFDSERVEESLEIEVGSSQVRGRVVDDETGEAVAGAMVVCLNRFYSDQMAPGVSTDEHGSYEIDGLMTGRHSVRATADGYSPGGERVEIAPGLNGVETIRLKRLVPYTITALWEDGTPIVGAALFRGGDAPADLEKVTDGHGRITVELVPPPRPVRFWIVPEQGSFADGELYLEQQVEVVVPPPAGRVELDLHDDDGRPIHFVHVYFAYGGTWLPRGLRETIERLQGQKFHSGPAPRLVLEGLAPGTYGFTAIHAFSESEIPEYVYGWRSTTIHLGPVEQSGKVRVGQLETFCRGTICEQRLKRMKR
jgi:hypothetical protein